MKNKNKFLLGVATLFLVFFLAAANAFAGCCVNGTACSGAANAGLCFNGTYYEGNCGSISQCGPANSSTNATSYTTTGTQATLFPNPIGFTKVSDFLDAVLNNLMGIIAIIAVIFIVIGGVMYMTSAGDEKMITRAKKTWTAAVIGLAIALAAPTFLKEIQSLLGGASGTGGSAQSWVSGALTIRQIAVNVLNLLLSIIGIVAMIAMVVGGGMYLTAYGDEKKIDTAKKIITYAIIGIVVALASLVIIRQVDEIIRGGSAVGAGSYQSSGGQGQSSQDPNYYPASGSPTNNSPDYQGSVYRGGDPNTNDSVYGSDNNVGN